TLGRPTMAITGSRDPASASSLTVAPGAHSHLRALRAGRGAATGRRSPPPRPHGVGRRETGRPGTAPVRGTRRGAGTGSPGAPGRPVAGRGGAVDPGEEARAHPVGPRGVTQERSLEGTGDADSVLVLGEALVGLGLGEGAPAQQIVLVGREHHAPAQPGAED